MVQLDQSIDGSISDAALRQYLQSGQPSAAEKREIRQFFYASKHGPSSVRTEHTGNGGLRCRFTREHEYRVVFDKHIGDVIVNPKGRIRYRDVELFATTLETRYPWASEVFVGYYEGTIDHGVTSRAAANWVQNRDVVLKQYAVPRTATGTVPSGVVVEECGGNEPWKEEAVVLAWER